MRLSPSERLLNQPMWARDDQKDNITPDFLWAEGAEQFRDKYSLQTEEKWCEALQMHIERLKEKLTKNIKIVLKCTNFVPNSFKIHFFLNLLKIFS